MHELYIRRPAAPSDAFTSDPSPLIHLVELDGELLECTAPGRLTDTMALHDQVVLAECLKQVEGVRRAIRRALHK